MKIFKRIKWSYVVLSAMFLLLGIYLVVNPETSLIMICRILGAAMAVFGVMKIVLYFIREVEGVAIRFDFAVGLFCIILGALMLWRAPALTDVLSVMIGLLVLVDSVFKLQVAVDSRRMGAHSWWVTLVCTVVCLVLGVLLVFNPFDGKQVLTIMMGVSLLLGLVEHLLCGRHIAALLGIILLERGAQLRRGGVTVGRPALRGARDDLREVAPGLARQRQCLAVHAAAQRGGHILRLRRAVIRVKRQTAAHHARIQQQAERIHIGRGIERAAPENLGRHELQLLGRPVLRVRAGGRAETDRTIPGTADVVRADAAVVCPALRQDAADRLSQRGQLRARERLQPLTEAACGIECVFFHVIRTSLCPCLRVYIT